MPSIEVIKSSALGLVALLTLFHLAEAGVGYIRWGRSTCNNGAEVVYKGHIAGSHHWQEGSGSNYLCVHEMPQWGRNVTGKQPASALLYGVEYELQPGYANNLPFSYANNGGENLHDQDAVCVFCYHPERSFSLMIPGRMNCAPNDNWQREYTGYLMSQLYTNKRTEYICVDEAPEGRPGGGNDDNQAVMYPVQAACGSLPCPGYIEDYEVTCVVCTRY